MRIGRFAAVSLVVFGLSGGMSLGAAAVGPDSDPFFEPAPIVAAVGAFELGDLARAEALVAPMASGDGALAEACSLLGQIRLSQGRPADAVAQFEKAVRMKPESAPERSRLGEALLAAAQAAPESERSGWLSRARIALEYAARDSSCLEAQMGLLRYHLMDPAAGPEGAAVAHAKSAAALDPLSATFEIAQLAESFGRFDLAEPYYRESARLFPNPWLAWKHGCMLVRLQRNPEAREVFAAVVREYPDFDLAVKSLAGLPAD